MRRAREAMGTTDIATIVRSYSSPSFGFASRNFFVSFLAALTIDSNPDKYFSGLTRREATPFTEVEMPAFVPMSTLLRTVKVDKPQLLALNPALRQPVWDDRQYVPKGYKLRLPDTAGDWTTVSLAKQIDVRDQYANQPRARTHRVKAGETLDSVARRYGVTSSAIARLNGMKDGAELKVRATLRLPDVPATRITVPKVVVASVANPAG
jgi:membrane-bound lytic murein transglycosylase D